VFLDHFNVLILKKKFKNKKYYFNIFLNKKNFKIISTTIFSKTLYQEDLVAQRESQSRGKF